MKDYKIHNKGYTLHVYSNDWDDLKHVNVQDKDLAISLAKMCEDLLCSQYEDDEGNLFGVGDVWHYSYDSESNEKCDNIVVDYINANRILLCESCGYDPIKSFRYWTNRLVGYVEDYYVGTVDSVMITHSSEDIFVDTIQFK